MRASGTVDNTRGLGLHDHVCWSFDDDAAFRRHAREFLVEGLALGQRVCYIGDDSAEALAADLREADGMDEALCRGAAGVAAVKDTYASDAVIEPEAQVAAYACATEKAVAEGFSGLRVAADVTTLVRQPAQLDAFARYEHLIDHYMAARPFAALCGYDRGRLGRRVVAQVACMHPSISRNATPFRLYGSTECSAELAGELDLLSADLFPLALRRAAPEPREGRVLLDASKLTFIDHRGLVALDDHAHERGVPVELRTELSTPAQVIDVLSLTGVTVDPTGR
jgi:anti-anti-sigma regulatory factor